MPDALEAGNEEYGTHVLDNIDARSSCIRHMGMTLTACGTPAAFWRVAVVGLESLSVCVGSLLGWLRLGWLKTA